MSVQDLLENWLEPLSEAPFSTEVLKDFLKSYSQPAFKMHMLVKEGKLLRLKRGWFCVNPKYSKKRINYGVVANVLYEGPSYVSLEAALSVKRGGRMISADRILDQIAQDHLRATSSGARVNNEGLYSYFLHLVDQLRPDGIVCHILKGQIEYDFELPYIEKAAEELDIPVFRLETDYQYQDMEQLRIRMEAFGEMLNQRNIIKRKARRSA